MALTEGRNRLLALQRRWKAESFVYCALLSLSVSLTITILLVCLVGWPFWSGFFILALTFCVLLLLFSTWRIKPVDIARYLDRQIPELEESCGLLLRSAGELGPLEKLQVARTVSRLGKIELPHPLRKKLLQAGGLFVVACLLNVGILQIAKKTGGGASGRNNSAVTKGTSIKAVAAIGRVSIRVTPPAYTGHAMRRQEVFNLRVEEGSSVNWEVETNDPVGSLQFIFNDSLRIALQPANPGHRWWRLAAPANRSGFYQTDMDGRLSELYTLEVIKDEAPRITIQTPHPYTVIDYGASTKVPLVVKVMDDYGIADAGIVATIASGNGETVKFKEQTISFDRSFSGYRSSYDLQHTLDLAALGLKPGDELYFYCRAKDNHGQEVRTDMYIVSLPDTAALMSLQGLTMGVDVKPEYFRSERQIIIETEQLLKEKDTLSVQVFNNRSNDLGIDQKLLRLRYGKFLGEEGEEGVSAGGDAADVGNGTAGNGAAGVGGAGRRAGDAVKRGDVGDIDKILDAYTDKHDNAEDATYFEPAIKQQLKATLTEMWAAELRLRTYKPQEALPYAYKALRLLKDLQQKSRAYVAKTGVKVTPLDPAKRLGGKLEDIAPPVQHEEAGPAGSPSPASILRIALGVLEHGGIIGKGSQEILQETSRRLGREASIRPVEYLQGYQAMRRIIEGRPGGGADPGTNAGDAVVVQRAIRKLLPEADAAPSAKKAVSDGGLSHLYFSHLHDPGERP
jgi:Domain of unknown function (DUF4175)